MQGYEGFIAKLKRFDRRLSVEPDPRWGAGVFRIVMTDAAGIRHAVLRRVRELSNEVFRELFRRSPWKRNQAIRQFEAEMECTNRALEEKQSRLPQELHEEAWERFQHAKRKHKL